MKVFNFEQYSDLWWSTRAGVPTASNAKRILTAKTCKPSASAEEYCCELIAEKLAPGIPRYVVKDYESLAMRRGTESEPEARRWFSLEADVDVKEVGFCLTDDGRFGCSPDGIIGEDSGLELKCPLAKTHIRYLLDGCLPSEYIGQVHMSMIVTGRPKWNFMSYAAGFPPLLLTVERDEYTDKLAAALDEFYETYQRLLTKVQTERMEFAMELVPPIDPETHDSIW